MPTRRPVFGRKLQALRESANLSSADLARRAGVTPQAVAGLEAGARKPDWQTACELARALGVGVAAFADGSAAGNAVGSLDASAPRLWKAAQAYARAYDRVERQSRNAEAGSAELFARFQEAQVELNLAALDLFAGPGAKGSSRNSRRKTRA
jgi:transcriptional regulator with XRE-family HTH domain